MFVGNASMVGLDSAVSVTTLYGLDSPGIESRCERDFPYSFRWDLGHTQPPEQWVPGLLRGQSGRSVALTTHPYLESRLKKSRATPLLPLWAITACSGVNVTSFFIFNASTEVS